MDARHEVFVTFGYVQELLNSIQRGTIKPQSVQGKAAIRAALKRMDETSKQFAQEVPTCFYCAGAIKPGEWE